MTYADERRERLRNDCPPGWPQLTCYTCIGQFKGCEYAFDWYNTSGDCLAEK